MKSFLLISVLALIFTEISGESTETDQCKLNTTNFECTIDGKPGICIEQECVLTFKPTSQPFVIKIRYPRNNEYAKNASMDASQMYLRGNGLGLNWQKGKMMTKSKEKDTWEFQLQFKIPGYELPSGQKPPARFEFRIYLDDSQDMLGPNFVVDLPPSTNYEDVNKIPEILEFPWFFSKEGSVTNREIMSPQLGQNRNVSIFLPPSFHENTYKLYETLIMNDGQRLGMMLAQLTILMVKRALIKEILVIGLPNNSTERPTLLAVSNGSEIFCRNGDPRVWICDGCLRCKSSTCPFDVIVDDYLRCYKWVKIKNPRGQLYLDFIQDTIIPETQSKYRALSGAENVGMIGFSLGGIMSCHAIWTRPKTFGSAACMSSSFWWPFPENGTFPEDAGYEFTKKTLMEHRGARPRQKIYIDVGSNEGDIMISPARNASRILESTPYFELNKNLWFYIWEGEYHTFYTGVRRMWVPLIAFYGTAGSPEAEIIKIVEQTTNDAQQNSFTLLVLFGTCLVAHIALLIL